MYKNDLSIDEMLKEINKMIPVRVTEDDFQYQQYIDVKKPFVSMKKFYNFLLQERAGAVKLEYFTPTQELHEYKRSCNKKKKVCDRIPDPGASHARASHSKFQIQTQFKAQPSPSPGPSSDDP